jgi:hypothetical protein
MARPRVVEHRPAGGFDRSRMGRPVRGDVGPPFGSRLGRTRRPCRLTLRHRHRSLPSLTVAGLVIDRRSPAPIGRSLVASKNPRHPARVPSVVGGSSAPSVRSSAFLRSPAGSR